ncbi:glutamyl-tRNA reductase [Skermanella pratensis]|uniref:glutamyl-tRNA reductase n=1 Tax=Skermanella pratensis TaxID=2233999 RepID=UPI0013017FEF|nr:glutamyl-tRNA reductase [Skermanella pratensis]
MPASGGHASSELVLVGANHRSSSGAVRDLICTEETEVPGVLARLRAAGLTEMLWLSTCDRVEVLAASCDPAGAASVAASALAERAGMTAQALAPELYTLTGGDAVRHLFAVACSLDSQVVGEPHVLGQVKAAHRASITAHATGPELEAVLQAAYAAAKRVRTETAIAERPVSIAAAAVQTARDIHGDLDRSAALLIGLGDMGELMVDALREAGLPRLTVAARVDRRAEAAARRLGCHHVPIDDLDTALVSADIVVTAAGLGRYILSADRMEAVLKKRRRRPVFVIDTAIPGDVDPAVGGLEGVFVYDLADLERVALEGRATREAAAAAAWAIVDQAVAAFARGRAERAAVPAVAALRGHFEAVRSRLLADHAGADPAEATRLLVNRLLHDPSQVLRAMAASHDMEQVEAERLLRRLFRLDRGGNGPAMTEFSTADPVPGSSEGEVR